MGDENKKSVNRNGTSIIYYHQILYLIKIIIINNTIIKVECCKSFISVGKYKLVDHNVHKSDVVC